ncbi:MAG: M23 family metallopeptidase [Oscillospiraceae bacterium]|nr:M23 family metallopeptidase [Oscillospiraceae bacterium]
MKKIKFGGVRRFFKGRGFAVALVLSISAVGASTYIAYNSAIDKLNISDDSSFTEDAAAVENPVDGIPIDVQDGDSVYVLETIPPAADDVEEVNNFVKPQEPKFMPVEGEITNPFSKGELVKSNTLGVWRTHDGVDIGAPLGTEVKAMQKGIVSEVFAHPMWGITVTIDHGNGVLSSYMGLDKSVKTSVGAEVMAGDVIGLVGNTAEAECADPPHLHFAVRKNDAWVCPIEYIEDRL